MEVVQQRIPEIIERELEHQVEVVITALGGFPNFRVRWAPEGKGSHWDPVNSEWQFDSAIKKYKDRRATWGVVDHELFHELASDIEPFMSIWDMLGGPFAVNAALDPHANKSGMKMLPGTRPEIQAYIEMDLSPGGGLDYKNILKDTREQIGHIPLYVKAGCEIIRYWHAREFAGTIADPTTDSAKYKQDFQRFLDEIPVDRSKPTKGEKAIIDFLTTAIPHFETLYHTNPNSKAEKVATMKIVADNFLPNIWPPFKKLVDQSLKDQSMVDWLKDQLKQKSQQQGQGMPQPGAGGGGQVMMIPFDALPDDVKEEIRQKMKEHAEKQKQKARADIQPQPEPEGEGEGKEGKEEGVQPEAREAGGEEVEKKEGEAEGAGEVGKEERAIGKPGEVGEEGEEAEEQIPWDQLSDKAKDEIEEVFDGKNTEGPKVSDEERKKHEGKAKETLEDVEDDANSKIQTKATDKKLESHKERRERQKEEKRKKENQEAEEIMREMEEEEKKVTDQLKANPYHEYLTRPDVDALRRKFEREFKLLFEPTESPEKAYAYAGKSLAIGRVMQYEADQRKTDVFERKGKPVEKSFRFSILVDLSGSMKDAGKIEETFKVVVALSEALNKYRVEYEIIGFTDHLPDNVRVYKSFEEKKLTREIRDRIGRILTDCRPLGGTPTFEATGIGYDRLKTRNKRIPFQHNYFITLTDGECTTTPFGVMYDYITSLKKDRRVVMGGYGVGPNTDFVNKTYPLLPERVKREIANKLRIPVDEVSNSFPNIEVFGDAFVIIVKYMVKHPELFFR